MLLLTANLSLAKLNDKKLNERLRTSDDQLNQKLDDNRRRLEVQGSVLARLADGMTYLRTLGTELKNFMTNIWTLSFGSYGILLDLQTRVPREFGPCWIQEPLTLTDALGRVAPIHLELINSWEVFEAVLEARFLNFPGDRKIKRREYAISDGSSEQDLVRPQSFASAFLPGRCIDMCVLFQEQESGNSCPGCGQTSDSPNSTATTCPKCGMWFRRIEDLDEVVEDPDGQRNPAGFAPVTSHEQLDGPLIVDRISNCNQGPTKRDFYQEDMSLFKRVQLLQRKHQEHHQQQQNAAQYQDLTTNPLFQQSVHVAAAAVATTARGTNNIGNRTVYLGNIHPETTIKEICNAVRGGSLHHIRFIPDKHICFVTFIDPTLAATFYALSNLQGLMIHNRRLKTGWGQHSGALLVAISLAFSGGPSRNVYIGNLDESWTEERLRQGFSKYGEIESVNALREKSCAFVNFTNIENAIKAVEDIRGQDEYRPLKVDFGRDRCENPPRQVAQVNGCQNLQPTPTPSTIFGAGSRNPLTTYLNQVSQLQQAQEAAAKLTIQPVHCRSDPTATVVGPRRRTNSRLQQLHASPERC
ncbi:uncharacterized protein PAC_13340 [Phialocephala subalpina]|uniref:RRM domain-containing protein n=1 Tax=Phialocephala subalpina TaxID=576137 RepID=A0A1L7XEJ2_9HELO|nr:uncharacterized protein PAC_13340 [Phialocephala subalpina]